MAEVIQSVHTVKVKTHTRNGKVVKAHTRQTGLGVSQKQFTVKPLKVEIEGTGDGFPDQQHIRLQGSSYGFYGV